MTHPAHRPLLASSCVLSLLCGAAFAARFQSGFDNGPLKGLSFASTTQPGYGLLNAMFTLNLADKHTRLSLWGRICSMYRAVTNQTPGDPRTFGVNVEYRF